MIFDAIIGILLYGWLLIWSMVMCVTVGCKHIEILVVTTTVVEFLATEGECVVIAPSATIFYV